MPMNDPDGAGERPDSPATDDDAKLGERLDALGEKLAARRYEKSDDGRGVSNVDREGYGLGLRLTTDLIAGTLVGGVIGWLIDGWLGTSPWGLIVILMLGVAAGVLLALRSAGLVAESRAVKHFAPRNGQDEGGQG
jgi:ATP synthase protein I